MKNTTSKIVVLALTVLLLVGAIFGIGTVAADESPAHKVEILFNNLEYNDTTAILYAVQVDGTATAEAAPKLTLNFYSLQEGEYKFAYSISEYEVKALGNKGIDAYVFASRGIAPKDMTQVVYAQAVVTIDGSEYKSGMSSFSITEYGYKRLHKDTDTTAAQKELYTNFLATGTSLQKVLNYKTDSTPADYFYVNAEDAAVTSVTIEGTEYTFNAGIFKAGSFTLPAYEGAVEMGMAFKSWNVKKVNAESAVSGIVGSEITIDDHVILTPFIDSLAVKFDDDTYGNLTIVAPSVSGTNLTSPNFISEIVADPTNASNKVLHQQTIKQSTEPTQGYINVPLETLVAGGNYYELSYDLYFDGAGEISGGLTPNGALSQLQFYNGSTELMRFSHNLASTSSYGTRVQFVSNNSAGATVDRPGGDTNYAYDYITSAITNREWTNIRIEMYTQNDGTYILRFFFNNIFIAEHRSWRAKANEISYLHIATTHATTSTYYDNISFFRAEKEYAAEEDNIIGAASGTGAYYTSDKTGSRVDFITGNHAGGNYLTVGSDNFAPHYDKTADYDSYRTAYDTNYGIFENKSSNTPYLRYYAPATDDSTANFVVEMDIAFTGLTFTDADRGVMMLSGLCKDGHTNKSDLYLNADADGQLKIGLWGQATEIVLPQNTWFNLRLVYQNDGKITIFVNNENVGTVEGLDTGNSRMSANAFVMRFHQNANSGFSVAFDNLYVGYETPAAE